MASVLMATIAPAGISIAVDGTAAVDVWSIASPFVIPAPKNDTFTCAGESDGLNTINNSDTIAPVRPEVNHQSRKATGVPTVVEYPSRPAPK